MPDETPKPLRPIRDVAVGILSVITFVPKALWSVWKRRNEDK